MTNSKLSWQGTIVAVQPRIRLTRSFDQRYHTYLGYILRVQGQLDGEEGEFLVGIGKAAQARHQFRVGDQVNGRSGLVANPKLEPAEYYKTAGLQVVQRDKSEDHEPVTCKKHDHRRKWPFRVKRTRECISDSGRFPAILRPVHAIATGRPGLSGNRQKAE